MRQHTAKIAGNGILPGPIAIDLSFAGWLGPHAKTLRNSYTVPAGKSARFVSGSLHHSIVAAGTVLGQIISSIEVNLGGAGLVQIAQLFNQTLRADYTGHYDITGPYDFSAGDIINLYTKDGTTGGNIAYSQSIFIIEYG